MADGVLAASTKKKGKHNYTSTKEAITALAIKNYGYSDRNPYLADYADRMVRGMAQALLETTMPFVSVVGAEIRQLH